MNSNSGPRQLTAAPNGDLALVSLKGFGDLIMAKSALRRLPGCGLRLVIGDHLVELNDALGSQEPVIVVRHGEGSVPELFDARRVGALRACRSALRLRRIFRSISLPIAAPLVFDIDGCRERFIAAGRPLVALPAAPNVYEAYDRLLGRQIVDAPAKRPRSSGARSRIGIFPSSRVPRKVVPPATIEHLITACEAAGTTPVVHLLDGETIESPRRPSGCFLHLPRRFRVLMSAVQETDAVICADSMVAHLAEYLGVPVFVATPTPNRYWLPRSTNAEGHWDVFPELVASNRALGRFIAKVTSQGLHPLVSQPVCA